MAPVAKQLTRRGQFPQTQGARSPAPPHPLHDIAEGATTAQRPQLWLALTLPALPIEVHTRASRQSAPAVVAEGGRVLGADARVMRSGVCPGLTVPAARALIANLRVYERDREAEHRAIAHLAAACLAYTPAVSLAPPDELLIEIEGSLRLFGGARRLLDTVKAQVRKLGYTPQLAVAATPLAAQYLARAAHDERDTVIVREREKVGAALAPLPLRVLRLPEDSRRALSETGIRTLRDLLRLPRAALARRIGPALIAELDRALGRLSDPRPPWTPPPRFASSLHLPEAVEDVEALAFAAHRLLLELTALLAACGAGVRRIEWRFTHWRRAPTLIALDCAQPHRDTRRFLQLLRDRLERERLPAAVETVALSADDFEALLPASLDLLAQAPHQRGVEGAQLIERLRARLGEQAVYGLALAADHRPERAGKAVKPGEVSSAEIPALPRPLWLLETPRALPVAARRPCWQGPLVLRTGPERIECSGWDGAPVARDYYVARNPEGAHLWVYREIAAPRGWYLHGLFS